MVAWETKIAQSLARARFSPLPSDRGKKINLRKIHGFFYKNTYFNPFPAGFCRDMLAEISSPFWIPEKIDNGHFDKDDYKFEPSGAVTCPR
jgi:hypothetical protein